MSIKKNTTLELFKLFASYAVVFIHVMFSGNFGIAMDTLARFAVPMFFLTSGFFSYGITPEKIIKRAKHIFKLIIISSVCYFLFEIFVLVLNGNTNEIIPYLSQYYNILMILRLLVFNKPVSSGHLWYLWAILYVYIIYYFVTKRGVKEKTIFRISFVLLPLHLLLGEGLSVFNVSLPNMIIRNFAFMGLPLFGLGLFVRKHRNKICKISNWALIPAVVIGIAEPLAARFWFGKSELYIGSLFILFAIVVVFLKYPDLKHSYLIDKLIGCSTYIYIFHKMVSAAIIEIYEAFGFDYTASIVTENLHPLLVCVASTVLAFIIVQAEKFFKTHKHKTNLSE